jgi:signal transduction histidine kinase
LENVLTPGNLRRMFWLIVLFPPVSLLAILLNPWVLNDPPLLFWTLVNLTAGLVFVTLHRLILSGWRGLQQGYTLIVLCFIGCLISIDGFYLLLTPLIGENSFYAIGVILPAMLFNLPPRTILSLLIVNHLALTAVHIHGGSSPGLALVDGLEGMLLASLASCCRFRQRWENDQQRRIIDKANATLTEANVQLKARQNEINEVMAIAAHDLRSPLVNLHSLFVILKNNPKWTEKPYSDVVEECLSTCHGQLGLISGLLEAHKAEEAVTEAKNRCELKLQEVAILSIRKIHSIAEERNIRIINHLSELEIASDPQALERIFDNLLSNAVKFSPAGTVVTLRQQFTSGEWLIEVADEGHGVPAADVSQLFRKFYRGPDLEHGSTGAGLGLFIVQQLAAGLGGSIDYRPGETCGSIFSLHLPA